MVGQLGHEGKTETTGDPLPQAIGSLEVAGALDLDLQAIGVEEGLHFDMALDRCVLDGIRGRLGTGDVHVEDAAFREARVGRYLGEEAAGTDNLIEVRRQHDGASEGF